MTTIDTTATTSSSQAGPVAASDAPGRLLQRLGGLCLAAGPILFLAGAATAPHQTDLSDEGYVASLADHPGQAALSADLLHYSWLFFVFGLVAVIGLVPGRRGRVFTSVCAVGGIAGAFQISGLLLNDFFVSRLGRDIGIERTLEVQSNLGTSVDVWLYSAQVLAILFIPLTFLGLARARVLSWWIAPLPLLGFVVPAFGLPVAVATVVGLACWAPAFAAARLLVAKDAR